MEMNKCLDCGKIIGKLSKRCKSCARLGKNNPMYGIYLIGKKAGMFGKHHSKDSKKKISLNHIDVSGKNNPMYGTHRTGSSNPAWQGGISFYPYNIKFNKKLKEKIKKRDKYICQICGKKLNEFLLFIHHIDYNKMNCKCNNLITLCNSCHSKTNTNRSYWYAYFKYIQKN